MNEPVLYNDSIEEKTMTVKEIASAIGVSEQLVRKRIREIFPEKMENGKITRLNKAEVTVLKLRIQENNGLATYHDRDRLKNMPKTDLEKELIIQQAIYFQAEKIKTLQSEVEHQKRTIHVLRPKANIHDQIINSEGFILPTVAGKIIMGSPNKFVKWLVEDVHVLFRSRGKLRPIAVFQNAGHFVMREVRNDSQNKVYDQVYFTPQGMSWITNLWNSNNLPLLEKV